MSRAEVHVEAAPHLRLTGSAYPWINQDEFDVPVVQVELPTGEAFVYGSLIGLNNALTKMADGVPQTASDTLNNRLFTALPDILNGLPHANTLRVPDSQKIGATIFAATRHFGRHPFLLFAFNPAGEESELPSILRVGTGQAEDYPKCLMALGINAQQSGRRKHK